VVMIACHKSMWFYGNLSSYARVTCNKKRDLKDTHLRLLLNLSVVKSTETCRVKPLRIKNAIVASCWTYFTIGHIQYMYS